MFERAKEWRKGIGGRKLGTKRQAESESEKQEKRQNRIDINK